MVNFAFISMLGFMMMMTTFSMASHPLDPRPIPKYDEQPHEPIKPIDYQENTGSN